MTLWIFSRELVGQCNDLGRDEPCRNPTTCKVAHTDKNGISEFRYMATCADCPNDYPWITNNEWSNTKKVLSLKKDKQFRNLASICIRSQKTVLKELINSLILIFANQLYFVGFIRMLIYGLICILNSFNIYFWSIFFDEWKRTKVTWWPRGTQMFFEVKCTAQTSTFEETYS